MIDPPRLFDTLGKSPNFTEPAKRIHDSAGTECFQRSLAASHLSQIISSILSLTSLTECPDGLFDPVIVTKDTKGTSPCGSAHTASNGATHASSNGSSPSDNAHLPSYSSMDSVAHQKKLRAIIDAINDPGVAAVVDILDHCAALADQTPPFPGLRRYGNPACRDWHSKLESSLPELLHSRLTGHHHHGTVNSRSPLYAGPRPHAYLKEIEFYVLNAFGSKIRLDYGTGHELNFVAFIGALWMSDVLTDMTGLKFLVIFARYYDLVRSLILRYTLEPAGSHGVWGLDDHFHLSYLIGVSQFVNMDILEEGEKTTSAGKRKPKLKSQSSMLPPPTLPIPLPQSVTDPASVDAYKLKNFYFNAIAFINKVKQGPFWETSPILYDISGVKSWKKILIGLQKMYRVEVLGKFPVVQHFWFGGVFYPWIDAISGEELPVSAIEKESEAGGSDISTIANKENQSANAHLPVTTAPFKKPTSLHSKLNAGRASSEEPNTIMPRDKITSDRHKLHLMSRLPRNSDFNPVTVAPSAGEPGTLFPGTTGLPRGDGGKNSSVPLLKRANLGSQRTREMDYTRKR